jgi:hypothetical protein
MFGSRADPRASTLFRLFAGLALVVGSVVPSVALAWTRAQVREVQARLELEASGRTRVQLSLAVAVEGGWLERLELPGLDEGLELAQEPAWVVLESGERAAAQAQLEADVLTLHFARRALRRGMHRVHVQYTTELAARARPQLAGFSRLTWTLPGWEAALSGAEIVVLGPSALRAQVEPDAAAQVETGMEGERRRVRFTRVHIPRASPWEVALELPSPALARVPASASARVDKAPLPGERRRTGLLLGTLIGLVVTWGGRRTRAWLAALGHTSRPRLTPFRMPWWALGALCSLSGACWPWWPSVALLGWSVLICLGLERSGGPLRALALGRFAPPCRRELQRLAQLRTRERSGLGPVDPASALGLSLLLVSLAGLAGGEAPFAAADPWGLGLLCALLAFVASSRLWQPRSLAEQLELLLRAARRSRLQGCALSLLWYAAGAARGQPRLRVLPRARYAGLLRVELLVDTRRDAPALLLSVLVESGSPAARWVRALWPDALCEQSAAGARRAFLKPVAELSEALESLLEHLTCESQRALSGPRLDQERAA